MRTVHYRFHPCTTRETAIPILRPTGSTGPPEEKMQMPLKVTIERSRWLRGINGQLAVAADPDNRESEVYCMCVLGFIGHACGLPNDSMETCVTLADAVNKLEEDERLETMNEPVKKLVALKLINAVKEPKISLYFAATETLHKLEDINDEYLDGIGGEDLPDAARETALMHIARKRGIELEFVA